MIMAPPRASRKAKNSGGVGLKAKENESLEVVAGNNTSDASLVFEKSDVKTGAISKQQVKSQKIQERSKVISKNKGASHSTTRVDKSSAAKFRPLDEDVAEILRKTSSSEIDTRYKIPKKKVTTSGRDDVQSSSGKSESKGVHDRRKRRSESLEGATQSINSSPKKHCPGNRQLEQTARNEFRKRDSQEENAKVSNSGTNSRCSLKARARHSRVSDETKSETNNRIGASPQNVTPDTPQMAMLRAHIASRNERGKGLHRNQQSRANLKAPESSTPSLFQPPATQISSIERPENLSTAEVFPNTEVMDMKNPVPEIMQLFKNDFNSISQVDMSDAMDVDIVQSTSNIDQKQLVVIFDTNVWISHRHVIQEILEMKFKSTANSTQPLVIIPWMVLQEIDHNIHNKNKTTEFRNAAKFIHSLLSAKHSRVKGQQASEAIIGMSFNELMADDSILSCAIQYDKSSQYKAVLVTNDINLLNKALVHNITAYTADKELISNLGKTVSPDDSPIISELQEPANSYTSNIFQLPNVFRASPSTSSVSHTTRTNDGIRDNINTEDIVMDVDDPMGSDGLDVTDGSISCQINQNYSVNNISDSPGPYVASDHPTFEAIATALQQTLTSIIVPKMVEEYGADGWRYAIKVKPPFTVESGLKCIQAHWIAVFSYLFPSRGKEVVDELVNTFQKIPKSRDSMEIKVWRLNVCKMAKVLLLLNNNIARRARVSDCVGRLQEYIQLESND